MVVGIYNPYHDTLGGGEQYIFTFAQFFLERNHTVIYFSPDPSELKKAHARFNIDLSRVILQKSIFETGTLLEKIHATKALDVFLFYSDGSIPLSFAKKTYLVFQFPVPWVNGSSLSTTIKKSRVAGFIVNSQFTKSFIDATFHVSSHVIHPAIESQVYDASTGKKPLILSVGRFTQAMNTKRQDVLIEAFKKFVGLGNKEWELVLCGGLLESDENLISELKKQAQGYRVTMYPNISRKKLLGLYCDASVFWHAAGFEVNEVKHPERVEHFGIATLEAMASGAVPFVYPAGGQKEIVIDQKNGFWWRSIDELCDVTQQFVKNKIQQEKIPLIARQRAAEFDRSVFDDRLTHLLPKTGEVL